YPSGDTMKPEPPAMAGTCAPFPGGQPKKSRSPWGARAPWPTGSSRSVWIRTTAGVTASAIAANASPSSAARSGERGTDATVWVQLASPMGGRTRTGPPRSSPTDSPAPARNATATTPRYFTLERIGSTMTAARFTIASRPSNLSVGDGYAKWKPRRRGGVGIGPSAPGAARTRPPRRPSPPRARGRHRVARAIRPHAPDAAQAAHRAGDRRRRRRLRNRWAHGAAPGAEPPGPQARGRRKEGAPGRHHGRPRGPDAALDAPVRLSACPPPRSRSPRPPPLPHPRSWTAARTTPRSLPATPSRPPQRSPPPAPGRSAARPRQRPA